MNYRNNRFLSFVIIGLIYIVAFSFAFICFYLFDFESFLLKLFLIDIIATLIVWLFGVILRNSSVYDPYWSVLPMVLLPFIIMHYNCWNYQIIIILVIIELWGLRLTSNWAYSFKNLEHEDWRYIHYRNNKPKYWFLINLFGINLMPTIIVFLVMLPAIAYIERAMTVQINIATLMGALISLYGIGIAFLSDYQLHRFQKYRKNQSEILCTGLWTNSRHPNYYGENVMWIGIYLMMISIEPNMWVMGFMPLIHFLLFALITAPMMDKRQLLTKPTYKEYYDKTNMFLVWLKK